MTRGRALVLWGTLLAAGAGRLAAGQAGPAAAATGGDPGMARAEAARAAGRLNEAAALYREAIADRPRSVEACGRSE